MVWDVSAGDHYELTDLSVRPTFIPLSYSMPVLVIFRAEQRHHDQ